jgi:hypothetical protein
MKRLKENKGYLLVESMIAIGVALVGIMGILNVLSRSVGLNRVVSDQFVGNYLAVEGIEITKNLIDANVKQGNPWNQGFTTGGFEADYSSKTLEPNQGKPILFDSTDNLYNYAAGDNTLFRRTINIELVGSEEIKVNSVVKWTTRGGGEFQSNLEDHFFNWR